VGIGAYLVNVLPIVHVEPHHAHGTRRRGVAENKLHFALTSAAKARHSVVMNYTNIRNITTTTITTTPTG
jgi:hypothetical protein